MTKKQDILNQHNIDYLVGKLQGISISLHRDNQAASKELLGIAKDLNKLCRRDKCQQENKSTSTKTNNTVNESRYQKSKRKAYCQYSKCPKGRIKHWIKDMIVARETDLRERLLFCSDDCHQHYLKIEEAESD